jgi:hypothetical protein
MFAQHLLAIATASSEARRRRREGVRNRFEESVVRLLEETAPDIHPVPSIPEITRNIIRLQLYLNLDDKDHRKLNGCLNRLAISISGYLDSKIRTCYLRAMPPYSMLRIESLKARRLKDMATGYINFSGKLQSE